MVVYRTGETPRVGDIFTIYALDTEYSQQPHNQWKILDINLSIDSMNYQSMHTDAVHCGQRLSDVKSWYLFKSGKREKSGFGKFLERIEASTGGAYIKPKKKALPF